MPKFRVRTASGKTVEIEAETAKDAMIQAFYNEQEEAAKGRPANHASSPAPEQEQQPPAPQEPNANQEGSLAQMVRTQLQADSHMGHQAARTLGKGALGAVQWAENAIGEPVTPTPLWLEPEVHQDPRWNEAERQGDIAAKAGTVGAASAVTGGAPLAAQAALSALAGGAASSDQGPEAAERNAILAGAIPVAAQGAGELTSRVKNARMDANVHKMVAERAAQYGEAPTPNTKWATPEPTPAAAETGTVARVKELIKAHPYIAGVIGDRILHKLGIPMPLDVVLGN
jgi:hypothetical protein